MNRKKIGTAYFRTANGRAKLRKAAIWLIDGLAYAKDAYTARYERWPLDGDLKGYVRVNKGGDSFFQRDGLTTQGKHLPFNN